VLIATLAALCAAACFAVAAAFQHRGAGLVSDASAVVGLGGFVSMTLRNRLWIIGTVADIVGFALHAVALREGPLTLVQPLLVTGVVFALPLRGALEHRRPRRPELLWATVLAAGLALFLAVASPADGTVSPADPIPTIIAAVAIGVTILACWLAGRRMDGKVAAITLGAAAGLAFAAVAGLLKELADTFARGLGPLFTSWPVYGLIVVGVVGLLLNQLAYQAAPLRVSLPVITTVDPIAGLVIGVAVFDEHFRTSVPALLGEGVGLALIVMAAVALSRSGSDQPAPALPAAAGEPAPGPIQPPGHEWIVTSS
jgi:drug/metabolite transporter (DMT)-like permease